MDIIQKLLRTVSLGIPSRPPLNTPEQWRAYWIAQGQPWRQEPEIGLLRQTKLAQLRGIVPNIEQGVYPFKGVKLSRADMEWLLATHENGRGPVAWSDESQRGRNGIDLRGAHLQYVDLTGLPLVGVCGGLQRNEWLKSSTEQCEAAAVHLERADLRSTHFEGADLHYAHLERADLRSAYLEQADLTKAHLQEGDLNNTHFEGADLSNAHLESAYLSSAHFQQAKLEGVHLEGAYLGETHFEGANLREAFFNTETQFINIYLGDKRLGWVALADVRWGDTNLAVMNWASVKKLGDESEADRRKKEDAGTQLLWYRRAVRANRQLAIALQAQGLNENATRFAYRAQVLQRRVFRLEMFQPKLKLRQRGQAALAWLFSWFLFLLAGYGYKPERSFLAYLLVIAGFSAFYFRLNDHLAWYEAVVVSMTAFHGRGFSPSTFSPGDPLSIASAFEAFVGLIIEVTFIATLTQRFFNK